MESYLQLAVSGHSDAVAQKIALHLRWFQAFFLDTYGHDCLSTCPFNLSQVDFLGDVIVVP